MAESAVAELAEIEVATKKKRQARRNPRRQPRYNVVLWNDDDHTHAYVVTMLRELFGYPKEKGYHLAEEVDTRGQAKVLTTTKEHAELKRDQIHAYGKDHIVDGCQGSMWATIEPTES
ncbi:MAG TPA: ATP-dependent Clp protease adaptor ClpS [Pirellulales bacterium]|nr:ATP-dependent Clp protease adaptor ClpS [Pirellulales bacterium]